LDAAAEYLFEYLRNVMYDPSKAKLDLEKLPDGFVELGQGLEFFAQCVSEVRSFSASLSRGDLNAPLPSRDNELAAPLKALQSMLKHLTWQTQQVARGDYRQHVDYLGEYAVAFNTITRQLESRRRALRSEIGRSRQKTETMTQTDDLFEVITRENSQWIVIIEKASGEWLFSNFPVTNFLADAEFQPQLRRWLRDKLDTLDTAATVTDEFELTGNGLAQFLSAVARPMTWHSRSSILFVLTDISVERRHMRELETVAYRDHLTKQYNRHYGLRTLDEWVRARKSFALCFADIDNLKYVNDKFGHLEGDRYIISVAGVLRGFSPDIIVCRLGGDEFMLLAENWTGERAQTHMETLRGRLIKRNTEPDSQYFHSVSYGVVGVDADNARSPSELLSIADDKMYEYKRSHKHEKTRPVKK
jgi:diguanylate cyclase (GGDEF)-like protein